MSTKKDSLAAFKNLVGIKFQLYNSLFTALPFHKIENTGILLSLFLVYCEEAYKSGMSPTEIVDSFFEKHLNAQTPEERISTLFQFVQYSERQVVLFDALEDAAFSQLHNMAGAGTLKQFSEEVRNESMQLALQEKLKNFATNVVLTAHPTQFYPGAVLGIIDDLAKAIKTNDTESVNTLLQQLGRTPFFKKKKPTPFDEAISLIWYLEYVFYDAAGNIAQLIDSELAPNIVDEHPAVRMGFWPGGDRDGNPFVTVDITEKVAAALRLAIIKRYYWDVRAMRRRITFANVAPLLAELERKLYYHIITEEPNETLDLQELIKTIQSIRDIINTEYDGLFVDLTENLLHKLYSFGLYFANLDVRQESTVHTNVLQALANLGLGNIPSNYSQLSEDDKIAALQKVKPLGDTLPVLTDDEVWNDTLRLPQSIRRIQSRNGEAGCHRYVISQCTSASHVLEVAALCHLTNWSAKDLSLDIVPLFETIDDLQNAEKVMARLYALPTYAAHLKRRHNKQTIMLGFSDGTKDGGYLMANWAIYRAKEALTAISRQYGIEVMFFDGRGGPPSRGGGKTHQFYASMGQNISNKEIQLTIQGQTISSNFGTVAKAQYNIEQLIHAGIANLNDTKPTLSPYEHALLDMLARESYTAYVALKTDAQFLPYLSRISPLRFYAATNIGSRPAKRGSQGVLTMKDLRAIPVVGSWSQIKQNLTGYYGVGTAIQNAKERGQLEAIKQLYKDCRFFRALIENCEMSMTKCFFPLTSHLKNDPELGRIWDLIHDEYERTRTLILEITGKKQLMEDYPMEQLSIEMRERIVLPLTTIQQYAIGQINTRPELDDASRATLEKLLMRCSFGIINAGRNSA